MQFLTLIHIDPALLATLAANGYDHLMHGCLLKADALHEQGCLLGLQQTEDAGSARTLRERVAAA